MTADPAPSPQRRLPLTRERVLRAALALADEGGIEALSMRKLARELGVEAMSLYNHVANKRDLIEGIVDQVIDEFELPDTDEAWDVAIRACAISGHEALLRHPWACGLILSPTATSAIPTGRLRYIEWLLRQLREAGFSAESAYHAYHALDGHILGFTLWELSHSAAATNIAAGRDVATAVAEKVEEIRADYPYLAEHGDLHLAPRADDEPRAFEFGLDLVLDGLRRLHATPG